MFDEIGPKAKERSQDFRASSVITYPKKQRLSNKQRSFLDATVKLAATSEGKSKHGCIVVKGGRVLSMGVNKWRNQNMPPTPPEVYNPHITVHAEVDALSRVANPAGATLYVARVNANGEERYSRPCGRCEKVLIDAGIKRVIYTTG